MVSEGTATALMVTVVGLFGLLLGFEFGLAGALMIGDEACRISLLYSCH